jgi:probable rRNA maturation factor
MPADVFAADEQDAEPVDALRLVRLAGVVLEAEGVRDDAELSLLFVDETAMAELNERYLAREGPTDVLAFPLDGDIVTSPRAVDPTHPDPGFDAEAADLPTLLGDVVVCPAVAKRNSAAHTGNYDDEMALLVVHGILHLLGMDHLDSGEAAAMERREQQLLEKFRTTLGPPE